VTFGELARGILGRLCRRWLEEYRPLPLRALRLDLDLDPMREDSRGEGEPMVKAEVP